MSSVETAGGADVLSASMEDYLETIFMLVKENAVARSKDIADRLGVNRSSVTGALHNLAAGGFINYEPYGYATLTTKGEEAAGKVRRRHEALRDFFIKVLSIDDELADSAACRMEHAIPRAVVERLIGFADFVDTCPRAGSKWVHGFGYNCGQAVVSDVTCENCIEQCLEDLRQRNASRQENAMDASLKILKPGERGLIETIGGGGGVRRRLMDMGIVRGALVEVVRVAPLGDPIDIKVKGYHLSLRREEAAEIKLRRIE